MPSLAKVTINWSGWIGAPGFTNLYFRNSSPGTMTQAVVDNAVAKVDTWKNDWDNDLPSNISVVVDTTIEEIDDTTGNLIGFWTGSPAAPTSGTSTGGYSNATGFCVSWSTSAVRNSRRIRGRNFVVPIGSNGLENNGTLNPTRLTAWRAAAAALHTATGDARLVVWARPIPEKRREWKSVV